jgi:hypothetical protein
MLTGMIGMFPYRGNGHLIRYSVYVHLYIHVFLISAFVLLAVKWANCLGYVRKAISQRIFRKLKFPLNQDRFAA